SHPQACLYLYPPPIPSILFPHHPASPEFVQCDRWTLLDVALIRTGPCADSPRGVEDFRGKTFASARTR
ncbi:hypothetical protein ElyMa_006142700, partial [Elysia marginata]